MIVVGALYFFSVSFAQDSPILGLFNRIITLLVGEIGIHIFFGLAILSGVLILVKQVLTKTIVKQFVILSMIISAILNFPVLEEQSIAYQQYGGYIGRPILWLLQRIFGAENPFAIKAIIVLLALVPIARIIRTFNIPVPKLPSLSLRSSSAAPAKKAKKVKEEEEYEDEEEEYEEEEEELPVVTKK